jgi:ankyrin repeat protein
MLPEAMPPAASPVPAAEALVAAAAEALADAADRGDAGALAALLPPLAPAPPQAALDAALLAAAGAGWNDVTPTLVEERDAAAALLLAAGAAVGVVDEFGATPLHLAAASGNMPLIRRLLAAGARVDPPAGQDHPYFGAMPQHFAASRGRCEALALLLDSGGQVRPLFGSADGEGGARWVARWVACCALEPEHLRSAHALLLTGGGGRRLGPNGPSPRRRRLR